MSNTTAKNDGVNRAKLYQLALFPLNNGATNVYFVLILSYVAQFGSSILQLGLYASLMVTIMRICDAITEAFFSHYGERVEAEIISPDKTPDLPNFAETFARQSSWEWNFGQAPAFTHLLDERFIWGGVELHFDVEKGHITRTQVFTDSLNPAPLEALAGRLQGCLYRADMLQQECDALLVDFPEQEKELRELSAWIARAVR